MNKNLTWGWFSLLRNDEHPVLIEQICLVMDKYVPEDENIKEAAARVKSHLEPLELVKVRLTRHALTPVLTELHVSRKQSLSSLQGQVRALTRSTVSEEKEAANVLEMWLSKHRGKLLTLGYAALSERTNEIIADAEKDEKVKTALETLSLTPILNRLKAINEEFKRTFVERKNETAQAPKVDAKAIRIAVNKDIRLLLDILTAKSRIRNENTEYEPLINALKEFLDYYRVLVQTRKTRKATEKKLKDENSEQLTDNVLSTAVAESA